MTDNTYTYPKKEDLEIIVGDEKQQDFKPRLKIKRWNNEVNFSVGIISSHAGTDSNISDKVDWDDGHGTKARFYEKPNNEFEFEIELASKPASNVIRLSIETKGIDFFYQPELTEVEKSEVIIADDGSLHPVYARPDDIIGSYAVYHNNKKGNIIGGNNYRAGKAFHIYRPYATDSNGWEVWCELYIGDDMQITIPQDFINDAVYPIIVDPTFGCDPEIPGGSYRIICAGYYGARGSKYAGSAGTGVSMSMYGAKTEDSKKIQMKLYDANESEVANGTTNELDATTISWHTSNFSTGPTLTAQNYWLMGWSSIRCPISGSGFNLYYDDGDAGQGNDQWNNGSLYNGWSSDCSIDSTITAKAYSIYCTYTVVAAGTRPSRVFGGPLWGPFAGPIV